MESEVLLLQFVLPLHSLLFYRQLLLPHAFALTTHPLNVSFLLCYLKFNSLELVSEQVMLPLPYDQSLFLLNELGPLAALLLSDLNDLSLKSALVLLESLAELLHLNLSLCDIAFDLGKSFILLPKTRLVHLVKVDI